MYILRTDLGEENILVSYKTSLKDRAIQEIGLPIDELKRLLTNEREEWTRNDMESWLSTQNMYPGTMEGIRLKSLNLTFYSIPRAGKRLFSRIRKLGRFYYVGGVLMGWYMGSMGWGRGGVPPNFGS